MAKKTKASKTTHKKIAKTEEQKHEKFLKDNFEKAKEAWKQCVDDIQALGYKIDPAIQNAQIPGMYMALIRLRGMGMEELDRFQNPEKWKKIDEERHAAQEKALAAQKAEDEAKETEKPE
jgi:hypothetical protein